MATAKKLGPQTAEYTPEMVAETKQLFDCMGLVWMRPRWRLKELAYDSNV